MTERYLTVDETADVLRQKPSTLHYWRGQGRGPKAFKLGKRLLYKESDVQAYIDAAIAGDVHGPTSAA